MDKLKLFVMGEVSADPDKWIGGGTRALAIAHSAEEAAAMVDFTCTAIEIPFDKLMLLTTEDVPDGLR